MNRRRLKLILCLFAFNLLFLYLYFYLSWSLNPTVTIRSCNDNFDNGFTRQIDVLKSLKSVVTGARGGRK
ncbi:hypothetical protein CsSME_00005861 [Camellia sinensis var. sinensis]